MAKFKGFLASDNKQSVTRLAHRSLDMLAASVQGAVEVQFQTSSNGTIWAYVYLKPWQGRGVRKKLYVGPVERYHQSPQAID